MRSSKSSLVLCFATIMALASCGLLSAVAEKPSAEVTHVSLSSAGFSGVRGQLGLNVHNPNAFGMPLHRIDWTLSVGSAQAVQGNVELSENIPAKANLPVTTSLTISALNAVQVASQLASGVRSYNLRATLYFQTSYGELKVDLQHNGDLR